MSQESELGSGRWLGVADSGEVIEIVCGSDCEEQLAPRWPPLGLARARYDVSRVARRIAVSGHPERPDVTVDGEDSPGGWNRVESELALFAAERLAGLVAIHAAVIAQGGRAIVVPGASGAGKSTLCVAALVAGAEVLTDEYALVDPATGLVTGWQRPIRVRSPDGGIDRLGTALASGPVPVAVVALVAYQAGAGPWKPITRAEATLGLMANTVCAQSRPDEALDAALALARSSSAVGGHRGEAPEAVIRLLELLEIQRVTQP